jgi:hypothetical protein
MTITRSAASTAFQRFRTVADAPDGTFVWEKGVLQMIGDVTDDIIYRARARGLEVDNSDGAFNLEVEIYDYLRSTNEERFMGGEGYGKAIDMADRDGVERINAGLIRDRDFLASMKRDTVTPEIAAARAYRYSVEEQADGTHAVFCDGGFVKGPFPSYDRAAALAVARDLASADEALGFTTVVQA